MHECTRLLMIPAMPTLTKLRLVSRSWRIAYPVHRCISTSRSPQPPAFVFDIVGSLTASRIGVADHPLRRTAFCSEARRSWGRRGTRSGSFTVTIRSTGGLALIHKHVEPPSHYVSHREIPYIFVRDGSKDLMPSQKRMTPEPPADQRRWC